MTLIDPGNLPQTIFFLLVLNTVSLAVNRKSPKKYKIKRKNTFLREIPHIADNNQNPNEIISKDLFAAINA